jgi:hypothetical protein
LIVFDRWLAKIGIRDDGLDAVREHLWQWMTVDEHSFGAWSGFESPVLDAALGDELPAELTLQCEQRGVDTAEFTAVLGDVVEITYLSLYGAAQDDASLEHLRRVLEVCAAAGITPPSAEPFAQSLFTDGHGFGRPTLEDVEQWRRLNSSM